MGPNVPKKVFLVENRKSEHYQWILHIRVALVPDFILNRLFWFFGLKLSKNGVLGQKWKKWTWFCIFEITVAQGYHVRRVTFMAFFRIARYHYYFNVSSPKACRDSNFKGMGIYCVMLIVLLKVYGLLWNFRYWTISRYFVKAVVFPGKSIFWPLLWGTLVLIFALLRTLYCQNILMVENLGQ